MKKKLEKKARLLAQKAAKKAKEKEMKRERKADTQKRIDEGQVPTEQLEQMREHMKKTKEAVMSKRVEKKERLEQAQNNPTSCKVAIDVDFEHLMKESELNSLCTQIAFAYGANANSSNPFCLSLVGMQEDSYISKFFNEKVSGFEKWVIHCNSKKIEDMEDKSNLVYLTADTETDLESLDPLKTYIIGGIVDHNRHKNISKEKAERIGIEMRRLAIPKSVTGTARRVMTVNHVFDILVKYNETKDWDIAFAEAIPKRRKNGQ